MRFRYQQQFQELKLYYNNIVLKEGQISQYVKLLSWFHFSSKPMPETVASVTDIDT